MQAKDGFHQARFAAAAFAHHGNRFTMVQVKANAVHRVHITRRAQNPFGAAQTIPANPAPISSTPFWRTSGWFWNSLLLHEVDFSSINHGFRSCAYWYNQHLTWRPSFLTTGGSFSHAANREGQRSLNGSRWAGPAGWAAEPVIKSSSFSPRRRGTLSISLRE
jgi:hypothetical protein